MEASSTSANPCAWRRATGSRGIVSGSRASSDDRANPSQYQLPACDGGGCCSHGECAGRIGAAHGEMRRCGWGMMRWIAGSSSSSSLSSLSLSLDGSAMAGASGGASVTGTGIAAGGAGAGDAPSAATSGAGSVTASAGDASSVAASGAGSVVASVG